MPRSSDQTRKRILDAAYQLFRRQGYSRVSMDEIAAATTRHQAHALLPLQEQGPAARRCARSAASSRAGGLQDLRRPAVGFARGHHRRPVPRARRLGRPAALGGLRLHAPRHRARRPARPSGATDRSPPQGDARSPSRRAAGPFRRRASSRDRPRSLAAVGGRDLAHPGPWRSRLCRRSRAGGADASSLVRRNALVDVRRCPGSRRSLSLPVPSSRDN